MLEFKDGWNVEIRRYANKYGAYAGYLESFDSKSIIIALWGAEGHFQDKWAKKFMNDARAIHDKTRVVTIEQGAHQPEDCVGGGFKLHFTGRDADGFAFHFYITQLPDGTPHIGEITYKDNGQLKSCLYN
jgi:hypothetical protein